MLTYAELGKALTFPFRKSFKNSPKFNLIEQLSALGEANGYAP